MMPKEQSIYEIQYRLERMVIFHNSFQESIRRIEDCHKFPFAGSQTRSLLIVGGTGTGKSTLQTTLLSRYPRRATDGGRKIPIFSFRIPSSPSESALIDAILHGFGPAYAVTGSKQEKERRIRLLMKSYQTEMLFIDEFQHLYDRGKLKTYMKVTDWLKELIDDIKIPVVAFGLARSKELIDVNDQIRRRFSATHILRPWSLTSSEEKIDYLSFLRELERTLEFPVSSGFIEPEMAERIFYASDGVIGYITKLVAVAARYAYKESSPCIEMTHLKRAFLTEIWGDAQGANNPFDPAFIPRRLNRAGEPFSPSRRQ